ncbi:YmfQ family protein [Komagataeibacter rhaeticus]|uniref:YmfQ family protein n=1 Tax=Komagataeibacter rhaeticus TaxID=215221 RepID=UPI00178C25D3|nr:YmfQ family protein [Komagataeibacter rhaeticus]WPP22451.1 YmfQ family protein [Komagataeibacter rhaeticus]
MAAPQYSVADFRTALLNLLPRGRIWSRDPDGMPYQMAAVWAPSFQRSAQSAGDLIDDAFPSTTVNLLPEWEATLGLPDPCAGESPTVELRRAQVVARLTDNGGASIPYFVAFAKTLGYDITITQFAPSRFRRKFGTPFGGDAWAYTWQVNCPQLTINRLKFGQSFGNPWATWSNAVLECELTARKPAHTILIFNYS